MLRSLLILITFATFAGSLSACAARPTGTDSEGDDPRELGDSASSLDGRDPPAADAQAVDMDPSVDDAGAAPDSETSEPPSMTDSDCTETCRYSGDGECDDGGPESLYSLCDLGTDCMDCGRRTGESGATPTPPDPRGTSTLPHAGIELDGMSIPRAGLANPTLMRALGLSTEPIGTLETDAGLTWVRGKVSWFGGPTDTGVSSTETGAVTGERLRSLGSPLDPSPAEAARRPADYYFCAMRWNYAPRGVSWLRTARLIVRNPDTGTTLVVRPVDWGPNTRTNRVIDLSLEALHALGLSTDDDALIAWAPEDTRLGPVP